MVIPKKETTAAQAGRMSVSLSDCAWMVNGSSFGYEVVLGLDHYLRIIYYNTLFVIHNVITSNYK